MQGNMNVIDRINADHNANQDSARERTAQVRELHSSALFRVHHLSDTRDRVDQELSHNYGLLDVRKDVEKAIKLFRTPTTGCAYRLVAEVTASGLDAVFELTNTIDRQWWINPGATPRFQGEGCRSTSVGDIVVEAGGIGHFCDSVGWVSLGALECPAEAGDPSDSRTAGGQPVATGQYDGSHIESHCPECGEYESECVCVEVQSQEGGLPIVAPQQEAGKLTEGGASVVYRVTRDQAVWERETFEIEVPPEIPEDEHDDYVRDQMDDANTPRHIEIVNGVEGIDTIVEMVVQPTE